jgi:hypothetical protein
MIAYVPRACALLKCTLKLLAFLTLVLSGVAPMATHASVTPMAAGPAA